MNIPGFVGEVTVQVIAAATLVFIVIAVISLKNRNFMAFIGFGLLYGVITFTMLDPQWLTDLAGWGIKGVTK